LYLLLRCKITKKKEDIVCFSKKSCNFVPSLLNERNVVSSKKAKEESKNNNYLKLKKL